MHIFFTWSSGKQCSYWSTICSFPFTDWMVRNFKNCHLANKLERNWLQCLFSFNNYVKKKILVVEVQNVFQNDGKENTYWLRFKILALRLTVITISINDDRQLFSTVYKKHPRNISWKQSGCWIAVKHG